MQQSHDEKQNIVFIDLLRGGACLLVVYCHLIGYRAPIDWYFKPYLDRFIIEPFGIIWNFGYLGVAIFFIISGFIISHVAQRETRKEFAIKRLFRIYPAVWVALALATALAHLVTHPTASLSPANLLMEASLLWSQFIVISPTYTLAIELMFYMLAMVILPLIRTQPKSATGIVILMPMAIHFLLSAPVYASNSPKLIGLFGYTAFLAVFAMGMAIYYGWTKRIRLISVVALLAGAYCSLILTTGTSAVGRGFQSNTFYALLLFCMAIWATPRLKIGPIVGMIAAASYSIYLLHDPIGRTIIALLQEKIGYSASLIISLTLISLAALASLVFVERPSQTAARRLIRLWNTPVVIFSESPNGANSLSRVIVGSVPNPTLRPEATEMLSGTHKGTEPERM